VGLSPNATGARVTRLLDEGIISGIHARANHAALGRTLEASVDCWMETREDEQWELFAAFVAQEDRILDAVHITGKVDYRLSVVVATPEELDELLTDLKRNAGIAETDTRLVLRRYPAGGDPRSSPGT